VPENPTKRLHYFDHQFLRAADFTAEQEYHLGRRRLHNRTLHTWGIAEGLGLTFDAGAAAVTVQPGTAIDGEGHEIVLTEDRRVDLAAHPAGAALYITVEYRETPTDLSKETDIHDNTRWTEDPDVKAVSERPAEPSRQLILGKVNRSATVVSDIDPADRRAAGAVSGDITTSALTLKRERVSPDTWPRLSCVGTNQAALENGSLRLDDGREIFFADNGQIRSHDGNHRLVFNRVGNTLDLYEFGRIRLFTGSTPAERLSVSAEGFVGIGQPAPKAPLTFANVLGNKISLWGDGSGPHYGFGIQGNLLQIHTDVAGCDIAFGYGTSAALTETMRIKGNGNVGVGTSTPGEKLEVVGNLNVAGTVIAQMMSLARVNEKRGGLFLAGAGDFNHAIYNNLSNIDGEGQWDGSKWNTYAGLNVRVGHGNTKKSALFIDGAGNVGIGTTDVKAQLDVNGAANVWAGARYAVANGHMAPGSLTIGSINSNYGGNTNHWESNNVAALLLETKDNTEIAVHDSGTRIASLMYYEGAGVNRLTIGRNMGWDALSTLVLNGNVGVGRPAPNARLDVNGEIRAGALVIADAAGTRYPDNWIGMASNVEGATKWLHIGGITDSGARRLGLFADLIFMAGSVGIGTTKPNVPLEVAWHKSIPLTNSPDGFGPDGGFNHGHNLGTDRGGNFNVSILAAGWVAGAGMVANSDRRIKEVVGRSDTARDLEIIQSLRVTDYRPLDKMSDGNSLRRGFVAQEVLDILPQAVASRRNVIPDIYSSAADFAFDREQKTLSVTLPAPHGLTEGEAVQILTEDAAKTVAVVAVTAPGSFVVGGFEKEPRQVFVYGREVDDFLSLDYDQLFTTAVGALQQVKKEKDAEAKALWAEIAELKASNGALAERLRLLERAPQAAPRVAGAGKGSNGNGRH
jgi:hypothetical protein